MKRYRITPDAEGNAVYTIEEAERLEPGECEVRLRMEACSLNYRDLLMKSGQSASGGDDAVVPLSDGAGVVDAVGPGVTDWSEGDRVAPTFFRDWERGRFDFSYHQGARGGSCDGVLAEYVVAPAHSVVRVPGHLSGAQGATLPCAALTAWHALMERGEPVSEGDTVLCLGTGGVSIFALQLAKSAGARVLITSSSDDKLARARELGADETINYREIPEWDEAVWELTGKRGADRVIEVGGPGTLERSMKSVAPGGAISLIGVLTGFSPPDTSLFPLVARNADLQGIYVGNRGMFERMNGFLAFHEIEPVIDRFFPFDHAAEACDYLESGAHFGKVVVEM